MPSSFTASATAAVTSSSLVTSQCTASAASPSSRCQRLRALVVHVRDRHPGAALHQQPGGRLAEARGSPGHEGSDAFQLHRGRQPIGQRRNGWAPPARRAGQTGRDTIARGVLARALPDARCSVDRGVRVRRGPHHPGGTADRCLPEVLADRRGGPPRLRRAGVGRVDPPPGAALDQGHIARARLPRQRPRGHPGPALFHARARIRPVHRDLSARGATAADLLRGHRAHALGVAERDRRGPARCHARNGHPVAGDRSFAAVGSRAPYGHRPAGAGRRPPADGGLTNCDLRRSHGHERRHRHFLPRGWSLWLPRSHTAATWHACR